MQGRLKILAINTAKICQQIPYDIINRVYINQIIRSQVLQLQIIEQHVEENLNPTL